jgi:hypothetical protein
MNLCFPFFSLHRTVDNGAVFNVIVLIGSLIGTVVVAFTMIMQLLEQYLGISTDEPSAQVTGDQFTTAASIESKMASNADSKTQKPSSSKYVDFDAADRPGGDSGDDGSMMGARPFHGNVVIQSSECAIEMQNVTKPSTAAGIQGIAAESAIPSQNGSVDHNAQLLGMLADMQREMREQSAQLASLSAQMTRSEMQVTALVGEQATLKADIAQKFELYDQNIHYLRAVLPQSDQAVDS